MTSPAPSSTSNRAPELSVRAATRRDSRAVRPRSPNPPEGRAHRPTRRGGRQLASLSKGAQHSPGAAVPPNPCREGSNAAVRGAPGGRSRFRSAKCSPSPGWRRSSRRVLRIPKPLRHKDHSGNFLHWEPRCAAGPGGPAHGSPPPAPRAQKRKHKQKPLRLS